MKLKLSWVKDFPSTSKAINTVICSFLSRLNSPLNLVLGRLITLRKLLRVCLSLILLWNVRRLARYRPTLNLKEIHTLTEVQKQTIAMKKTNSNIDTEEVVKGLGASN